MIDSETYTRVVRQIAATRFPLPDQKTWPADYVTIANEPEPVQPVPTGSGDVYPSIVVLDGAGRIREGGVVEREVTEEMGPFWATLATAFDTSTDSGVHHFFVYVPEGQEARALELPQRHQVSFAGLRTYDVAGDVIHIRPVVTPGDVQDHR
jgi:hypothetical protein